VHHLAVLTVDLARAEAFYGQVLGLPVLRRHVDDAGAPRSVWLGLGDDTFLAVERAPAPGPRRDDGAPGWHCVALAISAAARTTWRAHLEASGHPVAWTTAYTLYVRDPDGAVVALSHWPVAASDETS
jgi:hypothetical protein